MTVIVEAPATRLPERQYIYDTLLGEFLGLTWRLVETNRTNIRLSLSGCDGSIEMPDVLFSVSDQMWLSPQTLPDIPIGWWDASSLDLHPTNVETPVPIIYGDTSLASRSALHIRMPLDIFGSAFFMLSRYEEVAAPFNDEHQRYPASASLAYRAGFLDRPVVNEYLEILWAAIAAVWPGLKRIPRSYRTLISCDVDSIFSSYSSTRSVLRAAAGDLIRRRAPGLFARRLMASAAAPFGFHRIDPFNTFDWMMDANEKYSNRAAFYFIADRTDAMDGNYHIGDPSVLALLRRIYVRGHEIGLHPSYNTFLDPQQLGKETLALQAALRTCGVPPSPIGSRQHYLRWRTPATASILAAHDISYDTTLTFADRPGFRSGVCYEHRFFDLVQRRPLGLRQRPLVVMEVSVMADEYLGFGTSSAAFDLMSGLRHKTRKFQGDFTLLWHNSSLLTSDDRSLYMAMIS